ncbi:E3 ubiquitin-protein ligase SMURF2 [Biomphalaria pfeifferi]|uniref:E3 ubiquitin-protein ligase SMURF2 n=1 Tax=Biomphalaria pfeifferi TaxID=112525 RepID=A0AAD8B2L8_BIOPF|nr:E3 ubiquitin-protein ligase SMURF2 [Biomphalaria pfeifferi]
MASEGPRRHGHIKLRLTVLCAKNIAKKDFFRLPDPFAKITVDGSGQCHSTDVCKNTLDPKWNQHYDLYVGHKDSITISVWNHKKIHKKQGAGFLGCVKIMSNAIQQLKDTGFNCTCQPNDHGLNIQRCPSSWVEKPCIRHSPSVALILRYNLRSPPLFNSH